MENKKFIRIRGAAENNLKHIDLDIPRDELVVLTGLSGSGKSSLAFDTIYAEGQRRYMESLSSYARQFLGQMEKPNVESIEGLPPAISIDQKSTYKNYEYIIVENNSTDDATFQYYKKLEAENLILYHTEDKNISRRKELYTEEGRQYYKGNLWIPDDLETYKL